MSDIDPEGFYRHPDPLCVCGSLYTYGGHIEPGGYAQDCPIHGNPKIFYDEVERLRAGVEALADAHCLHDKYAIALLHGDDLGDLLNPTEGEGEHGSA